MSFRQKLGALGTVALHEMAEIGRDGHMILLAVRFPDALPSEIADAMEISEASVRRGLSRGCKRIADNRGTKLALYKSHIHDSGLMPYMGKGTFN